MIEDTIEFAEYEEYLKFQEEFNEPWEDLEDEIFFV
jgi:hypothetical protein